MENSIEDICVKCGGKITNYNKNKFQTRFTGGVQRYLCDVDADGANDALRKSRDVYGMGSKKWNRLMYKFKRKNNIPIYGNVNAKHHDMINAYHDVLLRLMFIMDIRSVKNWLRK